MPHRITTTITGNTRSILRQKLIELFLKEEPGTIDIVSEYQYYVDSLKDGRRIYLKRPTALNKGVDFEVRIENTNFRLGKNGNIISTGNRPSHKDIRNDLEAKKQENPVLFKTLRPLYERIFLCEHVNDNEFETFKFKTGFSIELIMKTLKWLFIEQDITYWNRSGRYMLYNSINELWNE